MIAYRMDRFYPGHISIYTDGSRTEAGSVSAGVYIPQLSTATAWLLSPSHTVMGAELFAIFKALEMALNWMELKNHQVVIFTDSKASLHLILNTRRPNYSAVVFRIHSLLLQRGLNTVAFCWVRGHSGIVGNEIADRTANLAHSADRSSCSILSFEESLRTISQAFNRHWHGHWVTQVADTGCGQFRHNLDNSITYIDYSSLARPLQCAVARLRLGHAGVAAHRARFGMAATGICPVCQVEDNIAHFLLYCTRFTGPRAHFMSAVIALGLPWGLQAALGAGITKQQRHQIFSYLQQYLLQCGVVALM
jgi:ribonuclease HI